MPPVAKQRTEMGAPETLTKLEHPKKATSDYTCTAYYTAVVRLKPLQLHVDCELSNAELTTLGSCADLATSTTPLPLPCHRMVLVLAPDSPPPCLASTPYAGEPHP